MAYLIDIAGDIGGLQTVLQQAYNTMIVHCSELISVSMSLAGLGTLVTVSYQIWDQLEGNKPISLKPLWYPLGIGICISLFPYVIALINGVMEPTVEGTAALVNDSNQTIATLLQQKEQAFQQSTDWQMYVGTTGSGSLEKWEELSGDADTSLLSGVSNRVKFELSKAAYGMKNSVKVWLSEILQVLYEAAALCINTVRTFYLIILAILGPLAMAFSVWPGLRGSLTEWVSRYLGVYLWLPIANIFGSLLNQIQQEMIKIDIAQAGASGQTSFSSIDAGYIIFLIMGIAGYFTIPSVSQYVIRHAGTGATDWWKAFIK